MPMNPTMMKLFARTHTFWYRVSGGVLGGSIGKAPILLLTTTGRKSGRKITTPLQFIKDGDNVVLIASNAGHKFHAQWWYNIGANPQVEIQIKADKRSATAATAEGEERDRLWQKAVDQYAGYADYQKTADREIPVVVVTPSNN
ncbi:MAG: nitroreductase family deazaflavin-dependent oxidoreductase [Chloroflexi bacterium]|nr:nitroreductase family deazaflavin-dependent oxidoreductase [Chloroflexota bacterium]